MGLEKHLTTGTDNFKVSFLSHCADFPCNACANNHISILKDPCFSCGHNPLNKQKENEQCQQES